MSSFGSLRRRPKISCVGTCSSANSFSMILSIAAPKAFRAIPPDYPAALRSLPLSPQPGVLALADSRLYRFCGEYSIQAPNKRHLDQVYQTSRLCPRRFHHRGMLGSLDRELHVCSLPVLCLCRRHAGVQGHLLSLLPFHSSFRRKDPTPRHIAPGILSITSESYSVYVKTPTAILWARPRSPWAPGISAGR